MSDAWRNTTAANDDEYDEYDERDDDEYDEHDDEQDPDCHEGVVRSNAPPIYIPSRIATCSGPTRPAGLRGTEPLHRVAGLSGCNLKSGKIRLSIRQRASALRGLRARLSCWEAPKRRAIRARGPDPPRKMASGVRGLGEIGLQHEV